MKDLLRILALFRPHWPAMALGGAVSVLTLAAGVTLFALAGRLIASGADPAASTIVIGGLALSTVLLIRTAAVTRSISRYLERLLTHGALFRALSALRVWLFGTLVPLTPGRLATYRSGDVLNRLTRDVDALDSLYLKLLVPSLVAILAAIGLIVVLWPISPAIAAGVLALFAVAGIAVPAIAHRLGKPYAEKTSELTQTLRIRIVDVLQGAPDLLVYRALGREISAAAEADAELVRSARAARSLSAVTTATTGLVAQLALVLVLLGGHLMTGTEGPTGPLIAAAALFVVAIFEAVALLPGAYQTFAETRGAARRLIELSRLPPTIAQAEAPAALPADTTLAFNDVRFTYPGADGPVLDHLSFALPPGRRIALVGPSGAGKTTILQLALRFYDPDRGAVLLGGVDLRRLDEREARSRMSLLSQRTEIFHATLGENLRIARPEASDDDLRAALEDAGLGALMRRLPAGLDTFLGEQGSMISGGEARRVALARVLLKDAPILLLDEPTEGLDERTEAELIERLVPLTRRKSVLLVSHRRAIAEAMDEVMRIEAGAIRVRGRPQDILSAY